MIKSNNGKDWFELTFTTAAFWTSLTYGNGVWVAVASNTTTSKYSLDDGVTWLDSNTHISSSWINVSYGDGKFVAVSVAGLSRISTDGITWLDYTITGSSSVSSVTFDGNNWIATTKSAPTFFRSPDGITWTSAISPFCQTSSVTSGSGILVAGCLTTTSRNNGMLYSTDGGRRWFESNTILIGDDGVASPTFDTVTYAEGRFWAFESGGLSASSVDGANWVGFYTHPFLTSVKGAVFNGERFILLHENSDYPSSYSGPLIP